MQREVMKVTFPYVNYKTTSKRSHC